MGHGVWAICKMVLVQVFSWAQILHILRHSTNANTQRCLDLWLILSSIDDFCFDLCVTLLATFNK